MHFNIYLDDETGQRLTAAAKELGENGNAVIRQAVQDWLRRQVDRGPPIRHPQVRQGEMRLRFRTWVHASPSSTFYQRSLGRGGSRLLNKAPASSTIADGIVVT